MAARSSRLSFRMATWLSLLLAVFAVHSPRSSPATDPDVIQYLTAVFNGVKGSGRKPINEELNLLPDESEGFANMVRCFSADHLEYRSDEAGTTRARTNKIILSFHLYGLEDTDRIVSVRVVFKHLASLPQFRATVYEMNDNGFLMKLDSQVSDDGWVDLKVHKMYEHHKIEKSRSNSVDYKLDLPLDKEHRVVLELTELNSATASEDLIAILHSLNPFIAVYTYDKEVYEHIAGSPSGRQQSESSSHVGRTISKRQVAASTENRQTTDPFAHLASEECQLHGVNITVQELGWVGPMYEVILPYSLNFTFCYGRCDRPLQFGNYDKYTDHAKTLSLLKPDLARAGLAPCCAPSPKPEDTTSVQIILLSGNVTETTTIPVVKSCICQ